jgi:hypothetical protein
MGAVGFARTIPSGLGAASRGASAAGLACPALCAIRAMRTARHACQPALKTMTTLRDIDRGWSREYEEPILIPKGRQLVTLRDAGDYITKLPEAEHTAREWQAAMEALILVVTLGGPTMFARIGIVKALNRHVERVFNPDRKEHHWGKRKLLRDR